MKVSVIFVIAVISLAAASAHAGPCSTDIAQFEDAVRQSAGNPNAGPMAKPVSIKRAQARAQAAFQATLARAKRLNARGDRSGCMRALATAKGMYNL